MIIHKQKLKGEMVLPRAARILKLDFQKGVEHIWYMFNSDENEVRYFEAYATGEEFTLRNAQYIGTLEKDGFVLHYFEVFK